MFKLIERLRREPESVRWRVSFVSAGVVTFIIALVWLSVIFARPTKVVPANVSEKPSALEELRSSLDALFSATTTEQSALTPTTTDGMTPPQEALP